MDDVSIESLTDQRDAARAERDEARNEARALRERERNTIAGLAALGAQVRQMEIAFRESEEQRVALAERVNRLTTDSRDLRQEIARLSQDPDSLRAERDDLAARFRETERALTDARSAYRQEERVRDLRIVLANLSRSAEAYRQAVSDDTGVPTATRAEALLVAAIGTALDLLEKM